MSSMQVAQVYAEARCVALRALHAAILHVQYVCNHQRRDDRRVAFDDVLGCVDAQFSPRDLFVRHGAGIRTVACGGVADLAEIAPIWNAVPLQVLMKHWHHADREVACNAAPDLEEPDSLLAGIPGIPICE